VERHVVVEAVAGELLDARGMAGRKIGAQRNDDAALGRIDHDRIGLVEVGGQRLGERGGHAKQHGNEGKNSDHENSAGR
jgi:hypothetical protein